MKILYHHRTLGDGAEGIHIAAMVEAFSALGHEVRLVGPRPWENLSSRPGVAGTVRGMLPRAVFEMCAVALNALDYSVVWREFIRFRPDLLYTRHARLSIGALSAARRARVPSVLEVNCLFTQGRYHEHEPNALRQIAVSLERRALALADAVVAVSTPLARQAEALGRRTVAVLPNGADPAAFDPQRANGSRVRSRYHLASVLTVGWSGIIREWHGLTTLLDAVAGIPKAHVLIVGDGPARADVERHAAELGMADRLTITGRVAHGDMPDYLAAMDIAVVADERTAVASPMKLLEYMAMGRAVVAPRLDNIQDLITDGANGVLFTAGDSKDLRDRLSHLAQNVSFRDTLGKNARLQVERDRTWRRNAERVISLVMR